MSHWFDCATDDESHTLRVTFHINEGRYWPLSVLHENPIEANFEGQSVILTGRGSVWMYAHAAAKAAAGGCRHIQVLKPGDKSFTVFDPHAPDNPQPAPWYTIHTQAHRHTITLQKGKTPWDTHHLVKEMAFLKTQLGEDCSEVCLTGIGAVEMYAALAANVVSLSPGVRVSCFIPTEGQQQFVVFEPRAKTGAGAMHALTQAQQSHLLLAIQGLTLGVVGDPNSGKSVFTQLLYTLSQQLDLNVWLQDCDGASPTARWYLDLSRENPQMATVARHTREAQKVPWTPDLESKVGDRLKRLKKTHQLTIADLPGGLHRKGKPSQRIPDKREVMMKEVDRFVILTRNGQSIAEAWRQELSVHNLDDRIVAVIESRHPHKALTCQLNHQQGLWQGWISGLDRNNPQLSSPAYLQKHCRILHTFLRQQLQP